MDENQNIEYKRVWKDDYLKWICGFANANGGVIFVGKDDNGEIVGLENAKQLLEDIPNKVRDILGIIVDVNFHHSLKGDYLEIIVEPYPNPVNYKGQYHYRSGSTKQELKGAALDKFLLQKSGKSWDAISIPNIAINDLDLETLDFFKKRGIKSKRLSENSLSDSNEQIIENLNLFDNKQLKRASILLFYKNPEKFITGSYIKIGYFENEADLIFQDEIHGNLFEQIEQTIDLLFTKYIKAIVSYENQLNRIETYEYPKEAIREALLNAIAHKNYSGFTPIQIRVYQNKIMIWNQGHLPTEWTVENLLKNHSSRPYNPDIANALFRSGYIESWGRGITKMIELCEQNNQPKPLFEVGSSDFLVVFRKDIYTAEQLEILGLTERQIKAVLLAKKQGKITNSDYQATNKVSKRTATNDLTELVERYNLLEKIGKAGAGIYYQIIGQ